MGSVNGIIGGFTGIGAKTVLPSKASAKISMRLVANQDTHDIAEKFTTYVKAIAPPTVQVEVENLHGANPVLVEKTGKGNKWDFLIGKQNESLNRNKVGNKG